MSSSYVRTEILNFLAANAPTENVIDLSGQFADIQDLIAGEGLTPTDPWLGVQFVGNDDSPVTVGATNTSGKYRELGVVYLHIVAVAQLGGSGSILTRGETLRNAFRGMRLGDMVVDSLTPLNFDSGATLRFSGGYMSASFLLSYFRDYDL
jgi:hypothetical protein